MADAFAVRDDRILCHLHLVDAIARRLKRKLPRRFELDDLRSAGYIGLIRAAESYRPQQKLPFHVCARRRIHDYMVQSVRTGHAGVNRRLRGSELVEMPTPDKREASDQTDQKTTAGEERRDIRDATRVMSEREIHLVDRHYGDMEASLTVIGMELGLDRRRASELHRLALRHMRTHMERAGRKAA